jgi:hypothetical protein
MSSPELTTIVEKLCQASTRDYNNPYTYLKWPDEVSLEQWFFSQELISIYGGEVYKQLPETQRQLLSFYEVVNFFSLNIHGERSLMEGLAHRLHNRNFLDTSPYLHHFLDEENKHMIYFARFCTRYAGKIYPEKKFALSREYATGEEDFLFFTKVMIFEEIVDYYNVKMSLDSSLVPIARDINHAHHKDEARHLVFGRQIVKDLFHKHSPNWTTETLSEVRKYVADFFHLSWKEYYNPQVYKDAGLPDAYDLYEEAFNSEQARQHRQKISNSCLKFLLENSILEKEPVL